MCLCVFWISWTFIRSILSFSMTNNYLDNGNRERERNISSWPSTQIIFFSFLFLLLFLFACTTKGKTNKQTSKYNTVFRDRHINEQEKRIKQRQRNKKQIRSIPIVSDHLWHILSSLEFIELSTRQTRFIQSNFHRKRYFFTYNSSL